MKLKYILPIFITLFLGCNDTTKNKSNTENLKTEQNKNIKKGKKGGDNIIITLNDINLTFEKNRLIYPEKRVVLLFEDNSKHSKMQEIVLKKLKTSYIKTQNLYLKKYFDIKTYPTIIVLENNKTVKYENFVPLEILKAEGF